MSPLISIVVCTHNRSELLKSCLSSLESQCKSLPVEIIVVDNNSSDSTKSVVQEYQDRTSKIRYVLERSQGVSHARNRGFKEANGKYVAYLDDDARACPGWIEAIITFFENHPDAAGGGGQYKAFSTVPIPNWYPKEYGAKSYGQETRQLKEKEWIIGFNMVFRKDVLVEAGGFDTTIGMNGDKVSYGEETQLTLRLIQHGKKIYYCPDMKVEHAILPYKLNLGWLLRSSFSNGYDAIKTFNYKGSAIKYLPTLSLAILSATYRLFTSNEKYFKTRIYRSLNRLFYHAGVFSKLVGIKYRYYRTKS